MATLYGHAALRIDHVIYATGDLHEASVHIEESLGLKSIAGGRHDGLGTENRIVPLGGGYLELLTVADADEAGGSDLGRAVQARIEGAGEGLIGWAVSVDDVDPIASRLGVSISTISRSGLSAQLAGLAEAMREPCLPFFIARDPGVADPGGRHQEAGGISWVEVSGDAARLESWLGGAGVAVHVVDGPPAVLAFGIGDRGAADRLRAWRAASLPNVPEVALTITLPAP